MEERHQQINGVILTTQKIKLEIRKWAQDWPSLFIQLLVISHLKY